MQQAQTTLSLSSSRTHTRNKAGIILSFNHYQTNPMKRPAPTMNLSHKQVPCVQPKPDTA